MKDKKIINFLRDSLIIVIVVCLLVFLVLTMFMARETQQTVTEISEVYMKEMNLQLQQKFSSIMDLRLQQVAGIISTNPPEEIRYSKEMLEDLTERSIVRNFSYLGFLTEDGELIDICGEPAEIDNSIRAMASLKKDGQIVCQGWEQDGDKVLLLGIEAAYQLKDGSRSTALMAGIPMEYLNEVLFLQTDDEQVYSHIIDQEGNFVIRNGGVYQENYFERMKDEYGGIKKNGIDAHAEELHRAMRRGREYTMRVETDEEKRTIYCSPLSYNSFWYLVTIMPEGKIDSAVTKLDMERTAIMIGSLMVILLTMGRIFVKYFRYSKQQIEDISKAQMEAEAANAAKSEFLASMSHDIRTPMNAIVGMTEIALKNLQNAERVQDCLYKVRLSSKHLLGLINDVLDMSKIESGKMILNIEVMSLREVLDDIVNIIQPQIKARNQHFDIFIDRILCEEIYSDSVRLNQVLLNLLSNAVKFTPEGGRVDIHLSQEPSSKGSEYIRTSFVVADTGIGMTEEFQKKIWDTFTREQSEQVNRITGTGLGTAITRSIVNLMGGSIDLESEKGKGSKFTVTLDLKKADGVAGHMQLPGEWNILVVDDNEQLCLTAVSNLEELGVHAEWIQSGKEAVNLIEERHHNNLDFDFVLIDWRMPDMDGMQTIQEIRRRIRKRIPLFLISAYDWSDIEGDADELDIEGFISKPLFKSTLFACLSRYMDGYEGKDKMQEEEVDFNGKKVLLAEDIDLNWEIANEILSATGMELEHACNGKECLEMFQASETGYYDAILMDIRMPVMNGYEATEAIRKLDRKDSGLPIIAMTADAFSDDAQRCLEIGMNAHIPKPLDIKQCMTVLQKFLN